MSTAYACVAFFQFKNCKRENFIPVDLKAKPTGYIFAAGASESVDALVPP